MTRSVMTRSITTRSSIKRSITALFLLVVLVVAVGCSNNQSPASSETPQELPARESTIAELNVVPDTVVYHTGLGRVRSVNPSKTFIVIKHARIDSFMSAMTMPFPIDDSTVVAGVQSGDSIAFGLAVQGNRIHVSEVEVIH